MKSKFILFTAFVSLLWACSEDSPSEPKDTFDASIVCPESQRGTFTDERDGQVYKYTTIGNQVWMAENLKFDAPYSLCYAREENFCETFGRFYSLHVDGDFFGLFDQDLVDTICPAGWHVPSLDEWKMLVENMGGEENVGRRLMSSFDFWERYVPGTDDCGFSSKPAGGWLVDGNLSIQSYTVSVYWTSTARDAQTTFTSSFNSTGLAFDINSPKMTIRCLKD